MKRQHRFVNSASRFLPVLW